MTPQQQFFTSELTYFGRVIGTRQSIDKDEPCSTAQRQARRICPATIATSNLLGLRFPYRLDEHPVHLLDQLA